MGANENKSWFPTQPEDLSVFRQAKKNNSQIRLKEWVGKYLVLWEYIIFVVSLGLLYIGYLYVGLLYSKLVKLTTTNNVFLDFFSKRFIFSFAYFFLFVYVFFWKIFMLVNIKATNCVKKNNRKMNHY